MHSTTDCVQLLIRGCHKTFLVATAPEEDITEVKKRIEVNVNGKAFHFSLR